VRLTPSVPKKEWAYYASLLEATLDSPNSHHAGILILDEPRQQETERTSLRAFLERIAADSADAQIVYSTSETVEELRRLLNGLDYTSLPASGPRLLLPI
jgi:hypothetical protein